MFHYSTIALGCRDAVTTAFVQVEADWDTLIHKTLVRLVDTGNRDQRISLTVLNHCGCLCLDEVTNNITPSSKEPRAGADCPDAL